MGVVAAVSMLRTLPRAANTEKVGETAAASACADNVQTATLQDVTKSTATPPDKVQELRELLHRTADSPDLKEMGDAVFRVIGLVGGELENKAEEPAPRRPSLVQRVARLELLTDTMGEELYGSKPPPEL